MGVFSGNLISHEEGRLGEKESADERHQQQRDFHSITMVSLQPVDPPGRLLVYSCAAAFFAVWRLKMIRICATSAFTRGFRRSADGTTLAVPLSVTMNAPDFGFGLMIVLIFTAISPNKMDALREVCISP